MAPSIFLLPQSHPRREILIKVALRVARSQIKALFRPFYESCISEPPNQFLWLINHATHESATHCSRRGERRRRQPARVRVAAPRGPRRPRRRRLSRRSRVVNFLLFAGFLAVHEAGEGGVHVWAISTCSARGRVAAARQMQWRIMHWEWISYTYARRAPTPRGWPRPRKVLTGVPCRAGNPFDLGRARTANRGQGE